MAILRFLLLLMAPLLISLHLIQLSQSNQMLITTSVERPASRTKDIDCDAACIARCQESSRPKLCHRACGTCCARCGCVPSGTSGNYDECPCYRDMTTHGGRHKCP